MIELTSLCVMFAAFHSVHSSTCAHNEHGVRRTNLALHKATVQSSKYRYGGDAWRAVDGILHGSYYGCGSCSHTWEEDDAPWWMVDLGQEYSIQEVVITNRDTNFGRLKNFTIHVAKSQVLNNLHNPELCAERNSSLGPSETVVFPCVSADTRGRYVKITLRYQESLTLCEVEVYGPYYENIPTRCQGRFALEGTDVMPELPPLLTIQQTSHLSCATSCQRTELCSSFTLRETPTGDIDCDLYECKYGRMKNTSYGCSYFVMRSRLDDL